MNWGYKGDYPGSLLTLLSLTYCTSSLALCYFFGRSLWLFLLPRTLSSQVSTWPIGSLTPLQMSCSDEIFICSFLHIFWPLCFWILCLHYLTFHIALITHVLSIIISTVCGYPCHSNECCILSLSVTSPSLLEPKCLKYNFQDYV